METATTTRTQSSTLSNEKKAHAKIMEFLKSRQKALSYGNSTKAAKFSALNRLLCKFMAIAGTPKSVYKHIVANERDLLLIMPDVSSPAHNKQVKDVIELIEQAKTQAQQSIETDKKRFDEIVEEFDAWTRNYI